MKGFHMSSFFSSIKNLIIIIIVFVIAICIFFIPTIQSTNVSIDTSNSEEIKLNPNGFIWPTPKYKTITSYYGYRKAPTGGASSYHGGIDIGAPTGAEIHAVFSGEVISTAFDGANGFTVKVSDGTYLCNYSHVSPYFLVYVGEQVIKGEVIATVGPKNVYGVPRK